MPDAAAKPEHPITRLKREHGELTAKVKELEARLSGGGREPRPSNVVPVDRAEFYKCLIIAMGTHNPSSFSPEMWPGHKKMAAMALLAYLDLCEHSDEILAILAGEEALRREKTAREEAEYAAERAREAARKATVKPGPITVVRDVSAPKSPEELLLEAARRQGQVAGPMSADEA